MPAEKRILRNGLWSHTEEPSYAGGIAPGMKRLVAPGCIPAGFVMTTPLPKIGGSSM